MNYKVFGCVVVLVAFYATSAQAACGTVYARGIDGNGRNTVLNAHNNYRRDIANGRVGGQPRGVNLKRLRYDDILGQKAQSVSNQCKMQHNIAQDNRWWWVGQNIYAEWSSAYSSGQNWQKAVDSWFNEKKDFSYPNTSRGVTGHYTQVVWADTDTIGCDFISYYDSSKPQTPYCKMYTCNYGPGGNVNNAAPYRTGNSGCENLC